MYVQSKVWKVRPLNDRTSNLTWPRQLQQIKEQEATLWRRLLHTLLRKKPGDLHRLIQPIGAWNNDSHICWHKMRYCRPRRDPDEVPSQGFVRLSLQLFSCCCPPPLTRVTTMPKLAIPTNVTTTTGLKTAFSNRVISSNLAAPTSFRKWRRKQLPSAEY